ncbi:GMC family oxidoreductase N-terminal domain-containing protein [uncultured Nocardioides sp.]|uniref:GMC family oxidoreductase n=1 Tax=uncultured Nocardioides sp. TaxID=198441 RepID=UPI002609DB77|nr:GMC family oxidoreductase N-terminal domain-containing protein [uncultured Nocardioides sp.]
MLRRFHYDYVIVGSGAAGSVLAERLSRDPDVTVAVLEAGGSDRHPLHLVPKGTHLTMTDPRYTKSYTTVPKADGNVDTWFRGRVVGGSTTINGMIWNRGWAPEYDAWEQSGNPGWNWQRFLEAFKALENHELGGSAVRGEGGPVAISVAPRECVAETFVATLAEHGIGFVEDLNASGAERVGFTPSNIKRGTRVSAARAFLRQSRRRRNLTVIDHTEVSRVTFDGTVATGVEGVRRGRRVQLRANREVLICAGGLESPLLLERSGVGDPGVLAAAGVPVVVASPKVGENLIDHCGSTSFQVRLKDDAGYNARVNSISRRAWTAFKFLFTRSGVMSFGAYDLVAIYKSDPAAEHPDTQGFFCAISASQSHPRTKKKRVDGFPGAWFLTYPLFPTSTGSIHITGPEPGDQPRLVPSFPTTEHDRQLTLKMYAKAREILATEPFAGLVAEPIVPAQELRGDHEVLDYATSQGGVGFHTIGTCAIGPGPDDVVDDRLRVRGASRLRVVDASVFPMMPAGNTNAPTQAMAWIAADLILRDAVPAPHAASEKEPM